MLKVLSSDGTCDGGASWFLLILQERVEYSCATLICKLHDFGGRQDPLVAKDILEILGVRGNLLLTAKIGTNRSDRFDRAV